jgi:hypothetical protein
MRLNLIAIMNMTNKLDNQSPPCLDRIVSRQEFQDQFIREKVLSHWQKIDEILAKDLSFVILKDIKVSGITDGARVLVPPENGVRLADGIRLVRPEDLPLADVSVGLWLPYLPSWRMDRVEDYITRILKRYDWDVDKLTLSCSDAGEDELVMYWKVLL